MAMFFRKAVFAVSGDGGFRAGSGHEILPVAKPWGGGPRPKGVVEGPKACTTPEGVGPLVSGFAAATSPSLRDREDWGCPLPTPMPTVGVALQCTGGSTGGTAPPGGTGSG